MRHEPLASNQIGLRLPLDNHTLGNCLISIISTFYNREKCTFLWGENEVGSFYLAIISVEPRNIPLLNQVKLCMVYSSNVREKRQLTCSVGNAIQWKLYFTLALQASNYMQTLKRAFETWHACL